MIDRVLARLQTIPLPSPIKEDLIASIRQIPEGASVSARNGALYRACGAIKATTLPRGCTEALCRHLCDRLTVPVPENVVRASIRKNRNTPIRVMPDYDPQDLEVTE